MLLYLHDMPNKSILWSDTGLTELHMFMFHNNTNKIWLLGWIWIIHYRLSRCDPLLTLWWSLICWQKTPRCEKISLQTRTQFVYFVQRTSTFFFSNMLLKGKASTLEVVRLLTFYKMASMHKMFASILTSTPGRKLHLLLPPLNICVC